MAERSPKRPSVDEIFGATHDHPFTGSDPKPLFPGKMRDTIVQIHEGMQSGLTGDEIFISVLESIHRDPIVPSDQDSSQPNPEK